MILDDKLQRVLNEQTTDMTDAEFDQWFERLRSAHAELDGLCSQPMLLMTDAEVAAWRARYRAIVLEIISARTMRPRVQ